jgi:hypothetical protein
MYISVNFVSLPRMADGLISSEWMKHEYCLSLPRVENGLYVLSEYIRVSFVSLPRVADGLIISEWTKHEYCLSLPRVEGGSIFIFL